VSVTHDKAAAEDHRLWRLDGPCRASGAELTIPEHEHGERRGAPGNELFAQGWKSVLRGRSVQKQEGGRKRTTSLYKLPRRLRWCTDSSAQQAESWLCATDVKLRRNKQCQNWLARQWRGSKDVAPWLAADGKKGFS
jgi:hypothetical protein